MSIVVNLSLGLKEFFCDKADRQHQDISLIGSKLLSNALPGKL